MNNKLVKKSIKELSELIKNQQISPVDITKSILDTIEEKNDQLNAYINIYKEEAIATAQKYEKEIITGCYRGPLHGIPMALKDTFYFKHKTVTMGSKIHKNFKPTYDATVVEKLKKEGIVFTGTLNMHEYAWGFTTENPYYGDCRNPWDISKSPGGSSGGSAAALAANMTVASLGTDTGGSVRAPASACGVVSLKPTYGRISKYGVFPFAWSLDHVGIMTKTVYDTSLLLEKLSGVDKNDPSSLNMPVKDYRSYLGNDVKDFIIGINEDYFFKNVDNDIKSLVLDAIKQLEGLGAKIKVISIPSLNNVIYAQMITILSEASTLHHENLITRPDDFGKDVRMNLELGEVITAVDYLQAQQIRQQIRQEFIKAFKHIDVLITPTTPYTAATIGQDDIMLNGQKVPFTEYISQFTRPFNLTGLPAMNIPCGFSNKMPVGLQIISAPFQEGKILQIGSVLEQLNLFNCEQIVGQ